MLHYYNRELKFMREQSGEFAREFPKIAGRLALDAFECADPYIERLIEGFAFLAARTQLKLDAEFPRFTQSLLESIYPHYLAPLPSMAVAHLEPNPKQSALVKGFTVPRGSLLRGQLGRDDITPCTYATAHELKLFPIEIAEAEYHTRDLAAHEIPASLEGRAAVRLKLRVTAKKKFKDIALDELVVFLRGGSDVPMHIYEQLFAHCRGVVVRGGGGDRKPIGVLPGDTLRRVGYRDEEALLPVGARSFQGYRLLQEYFAFPQRFMFAAFTGLEPLVAQCAEDTLEVLAVFDTPDLDLENNVNASFFELHCTPVINLFPHRADRIHVSDERAEFHVVPDRTRPMDMEVYQVTGVTGYGATATDVREFRPFYAVRDEEPGEDSGGAYFISHRVPRTLSERQVRHGIRLTYAGSEVSVSLVQGDSTPYSHDLRQLGVEALCTNRDLPMRMPLGRGKTDFVLRIPAPVRAVRCLAGPTEPRPSRVHGPFLWRLVSHLTLNYLSLGGREGRQSAAALRDILGLYIDPGSPGQKKQVEGVTGLSTRPITRRVLAEEAIAFARGHEIVLSLDETSFEGIGAFLIGAVLEQFFARYVSINSFTETVVETTDRGEIMRWPPKIGQRETL